MRFEVFTAVPVKINVIWAVVRCSLVAIYQRFGETRSLHLQGRRVSRWRQNVSPKNR
jgi:hypothetical protein